MLTKGKNDRRFIHLKLDFTILYKSFLSSFHQTLNVQGVNLVIFDEKKTHASAYYSVNHSQHYRGSILFGVYAG